MVRLWFEKWRQYDMKEEKPNVDRASQTGESNLTHGRLNGPNLPYGFLSLSNVPCCSVRTPRFQLHPSYPPSLEGPPSLTGAMYLSLWGFCNFICQIHGKSEVTTSRGWNIILPGWTETGCSTYLKDCLFGVPSISPMPLPSAPFQMASSHSTSWRKQNVPLHIQVIPLLVGSFNPLLKLSTNHHL